MKLNPSFSIDGATFQSVWQRLPEACSSICPATKIHTTAEVESTLTTKGVLTMASGEMDSELKFFLYCQDSEDGSMYLLQCGIDKTCEPRVVSIVVKSEGGAKGERVMRIVNESLGNVAM